MGQTFDALKEKISNADTGEAKEIITQVKQAYDEYNLFRNCTVPWEEKLNTGDNMSS